MKSNKYIKPFFSIISNGIPSFLLYNTLKKNIIPAYTIVSDDDVPHVKNIFKPRSQNQFIKEIEYLLKYFKPIDLPTLIQISKEKDPLNKNCIHFTIDDGLRESYEVILPILKRKGIPATFFLNTSFIDNKGMMFKYKISLIIEDIKKSEIKKKQVARFIKKKLGIRRDPTNFLLTLKYPHQRFLNEIALLTETDFENYLSKRKPYLNSSQVKDIILNGFSVGAHSLDHPEYYMLSEEEQLRQTIESTNYITSNFNYPIKTFAFPFTDYKVSKSFFSKLYNTIPPALDLSFGNAGLRTETVNFHLQRISMEKRFSGAELIKGEFIELIFRSLIGKNIIYRY